MSAQPKPSNSDNFTFVPNPLPALTSGHLPFYIKEQTPPAAPETRLTDLPNYHYAPGPVTNGGENTQGVARLFEFAYNGLQSADDYVAGDFPATLDAIYNGIVNDTQAFSETLSGLNSGGGWQGLTQAAVMQNLTASIPILQSIAAGAQALSILSDAFSRTLGTAKNDIVPNWSLYQMALQDYPNQTDYIVGMYDSFAQSVMQTYNTNISQTAQGFPSFNTGSPPPIIDPKGTVLTVGATGGPPPPPGGGPNVPGAPGGGGGAPNLGAGGGGGAPNLAGLGAGGGPSMPGSGAGLGGPVGLPNTPGTPNFANLANTPITPQIPNTPQGPNTPPGLGTQPPTTPQIPTNPSPGAASPTTGSNSGLQDLSQLGYPLQSLASPLQSLGQMAGAGQQAGKPGLPPSMNGLGKLPPEGKLGGLGHGGGAAGAGGGAGTHSPAIGKPVGAPATAVNPTADRTVAAGSRAGLSNTAGGPVAGAPGAGAPGAGHQGAGQGAQHQANKALRRKKNGEELIGDTQAVVPVVGEPAREEREEAANIEYGDPLPPAPRPTRSDANQSGGNGVHTRVASGL